MTTPGWVVVVPQKDLTTAKSRLRMETSVRLAIASAIFQDTVQRTEQARQVRAVVVVTDTAEDASLVAGGRVESLVSPGLSLNEAVGLGAEYAGGRWPASHVAAMPADLAGVCADELDAALAAATRRRRTFVADRHGIGTTLLTAVAGQELDPRFGPGSRRAHRESGAHENASPRLPSLRHDVDDLEDLAALDALSRRRSRPLGPHLRGVLDALGARTYKEIA